MHILRLSTCTVYTLSLSRDFVDYGSQDVCSDWVFQNVQGGKTLFNSVGWNPITGLPGGLVDSRWHFHCCGPGSNPDQGHNGRCASQCTFSASPEPG